MYKYQKQTQQQDVGFFLMSLFFVIVFWFVFSVLDTAHADTINIEKLADSMYLAEGGAKTKHPYGILKKYKTTTPRQACINTIKSGLKRYSVYKGKDDFITFLSKTYAPLNADNDPTGLNANWISNVSYFYNKGN